MFHYTVNDGGNFIKFAEISVYLCKKKRGSIFFRCVFPKIFRRENHLSFRFSLYERNGRENILWCNWQTSSFIFFYHRKLCLLLSSEDIYRTLAEILLEENDLKFASLMVKTLNVILLTSSELFELRMKLKELKTKVKDLLTVRFCVYLFSLFPFAEK